MLTTSVNIIKVFHLIIHNFLPNLASLIRNSRRNHITVSYTLFHYIMKHIVKNIEKATYNRRLYEYFYSEIQCKDILTKATADSDEKSY